MTGCVTKPKANPKIILEPMPERVERPEPTDLKGLVESLNYYETLIELWENWGNTVVRQVEIYNDNYTDKK